ncbi:MAG: BsaWI family type II restriction enzyme [Thermocladium sp.]
MPHRCSTELWSSIDDALLKYKNQKDWKTVLEDFENVSEKYIRGDVKSNSNYKGNFDQAWKSCKGRLYEYIVYNYIKEILEKNGISSISVKMEDQLENNEKSSIQIHNWDEIMPDTDLVLEKNDKILAILSCKTSLRERLTETAFWSNILKARYENNIEIVFITTNKDDELQQKNNRYIIQHVVDATLITNKEKHSQFIEYIRTRYKDKKDLSNFLSKIYNTDTFIDYIKSHDKPNDKTHSSAWGKV